MDWAAIKGYDTSRVHVDENGWIVTSTWRRKPPDLRAFAAGAIAAGALRLRAIGR